MPKIPERVLPEQPAHRPLDRFWPYADVSEQPSEEELAALHPELREAIFGASTAPFSVTLSFPVFEGEHYARALELAAHANERKDVGSGVGFRHLATFFPHDNPLRLRDLYEVVGGLPNCEVLIDNKPIPYARELWLQLIWCLIR